MSNEETRRDFLRLIGLGGVVFASGLAGCAPASMAPGPASPGPTPGPAGAVRTDDFFFLQLSDTHWGFRGPPNPEADVTLPRTVATIAGLTQKPDFPARGRVLLGHYLKFPEVMGPVIDGLARAGLDAARGWRSGGGG